MQSQEGVRQGDVEDARPVLPGQSPLRGIHLYLYARARWPGKYPLCKPEAGQRNARWTTPSTSEHSAGSRLDRAWITGAASSSFPERAGW